MRQFSKNKAFVLDYDRDTKKYDKILEVHSSGIIYYIDDDYNVYDTIDIHNNITNPKVIAKYTNENGLYKIPDFNYII